MEITKRAEKKRRELKMLKRTKVFPVMLLITMAVSFFLVGYINNAVAEPITIRYATFFGQQYPSHWQAMTKFNEIVNRTGKGKVKVEFYHSQTLLKAKELFSGLMGGAAEAVTVPMVYWHGTLPISQGLSLPYIWKGDLDRYYKALRQGSPLVNFLNKEFAKKNLHCIFALIEAKEFLWTKDKPVRHPKDAKGLKVRTSGLIPGEVARAIGATPVFMPSGEIYTSLQRNTVDGVICSITTVVGRGLDEQIRYMTNYPFDNFGPMIIAFRKDWWDKLPADVRTIIEDAGKTYYETEFSVSRKVTVEQIKKLKKTIEFIEPTPESLEAFNSLLFPMYDWWVNRKEIGEPGKELLKLIRATETES